ncbi:hypothetical protein JCM8097_000225 [Rhodosporidiobolus ruineniae]
MDSSARTHVAAPAPTACEALDGLSATEGGGTSAEGVLPENAVERYRTNEAGGAGGASVEPISSEQYRLFRVLSPLVSFNGYTMLVEDPSGRIDCLCLSATPSFDPRSQPGYVDQLPLGQILAIKQPLKKVDPATSSSLLLVDPLRSVKHLQPGDPLLRSVQWSTPDPLKPLPADFDHKAHGNSLFKQKQYFLASQAYSNGLSATLSPAQKLFLLLNRSQLHLNLGNYASARRDASAVLNLLEQGVDAPPQTLLKAKLRLARALEGLRLLDKASAAYSAVLEVDSSSEEGKEGKKRVVKMRHETETGEYDWRELASVVGPEGRDLEMGDYVGPIEVVEMEGKGGGRGVVATRDVKAGDLLLVEKAFAVDYPDPDRLVLDFKLQHGSLGEHLDYPLACSIASRILDDPSTAELVYGLYGGKAFPPTGTLPFGAFGQRIVEQVSETVDVDAARIAAIADQNRFRCSYVKRADNDMYRGNPSGLFLSTSLFNTSCVSNAKALTYRDVIVVRARTPIKAGEEVTVSYVTPAESYQGRTEVLKTHFDDGCACPLCSLDRADGHKELARRSELVEERLPALRAAYDRVKFADPTSDIRQKLHRVLCVFVVELEKTYSPSRGPLKPELAVPYAHLPTSSLPRREKTRTTSPVVAHELLIEALLSGAARLAKVTEPRMASRWMSAAMMLKKVFTGTEKEHFRELYKEEIEDLGLEKVFEAAELG